MKIKIEKSINVEKLLDAWVEMFTDEETVHEFSAKDWEIITTTCMVLQEYYLRYGDLE